jgi:hypothetical protein
MSGGWGRGFVERAVSWAGWSRRRERVLGPRAVVRAARRGRAVGKRGKEKRIWIWGWGG